VALAPPPLKKTQTRPSQAALIMAAAVEAVQGWFYSTRGGLYSRRKMEESSPVSGVATQSSRL
jgi:hypothetical protein